MKEIQLTKGKVALVDNEDYDRLMAMGKWQCSSGGYAVCNFRIGSNKRKTIRMHRIVLNITDPEIFVDHRFGNGLDNRKENLRVCTKKENNRNIIMRKNNTSGFKGVYFCNRGKKYYAYIRADSKRIYLGLFTCPIEAARAYNAAALIHHGEFARLNEIPA